MILWNFPAPREFSFADYTIPSAVWVGSPGPNYRQVIVPLELNGHGFSHLDDTFDLVPSRTARPKIVRKEASSPGIILRLSAYQETGGRVSGRILVHPASTHILVIAEGIGGQPVTGQIWQEAIVACWDEATFYIQATALPDSLVKYNGVNVGVIHAYEPLLYDVSTYLELDDPRVPRWGQPPKVE